MNLRFAAQNQQRFPDVNTIPEPESCAASQRPGRATFVANHGLRTPDAHNDTWGETRDVCYTWLVPEPRPVADLNASSESAELDTEDASRFVCDLCGKAFRGAPGGSGLFMWARGNEIRTEEPPLCKACATKLTLGAYAAYYDDGADE